MERCAAVCGVVFIDARVVVDVRVVALWATGCLLRSVCCVVCT